MALPKGNIPWNKGLKATAVAIKHQSESHIGKHCSPKTEFQKGLIPWHKGTKGIVQGFWKNKKRPNISGENHWKWMGGTKLKNSRRNAKRRKLNHICLNSCEQDGWVGHHIDYDYVIFVPEELHKSISHSVTNNKNMDLINNKVYEWYVNNLGTIIKIGDSQDVLIRTLLERSNNAGRTGFGSDDFNPGKKYATA